MAGGRPTSFRPEYVAQAEKLCRLGATDIELADFFEVDLPELAAWAWRSEEFYNAITPSDDKISLWALEKKTKRNKINEGKRRRLLENPSQRLRAAVSARMWAALKGRSDGALFSRLGYSVEELVDHLQARFSQGMSWENYGAWHVDHVRPCSSFDLADPQQFSQCWALNNLSPLWAHDNIKKGSTYACS